MTTQTTMHDKLLRLLRRKWVSPLDALREANCLSLSQRCGEMRRSGLKVKDKWVQLGNGKRIKAYRLEA
jgi:hypothetical protein